MDGAEAVLAKVCFGNDELVEVLLSDSTHANTLASNDFFLEPELSILVFDCSIEWVKSLYDDKIGNATSGKLFRITAAEAPL